MTANGPFRYTSPAPPKSATGTVADAYAQMRSDFGIDNPATFVVLSDAPTILTAAWALMRESLLVGATSRTEKELVAAGVSLANRCPFCIDAHTVLLHATGDHRLAETVGRDDVPADPYQARLLAWGKDVRTPKPFPAARTPAYLGTALAFHFINRIVSSLVTENMLPGNVQRFRVVRSLAGRTVAGAVRRELSPGDSLALLDDTLVDDVLVAEPSWAAGTPVGTAYAALLTAACAGAGLLSEDDQELVSKTVAAWDGSHPEPTGGWLPDRSERPGARLALLAALAPYRITDEDVAAWRRPEHRDHCLVHLIAYGAITAVARIEGQSV
ncbi:carboxymuconolactone decarboxylase family protein [Streptomyces beijiangensis]|uniref:Carboxymuconolactone decarboxylase family protein n=1 Tax=Streptomyces beijiangensis TaxID=163361 RepID=A0A939FC14_9ACTN|nr:carboxymuconolactone decarboxylase family protein [Streptomyces beijiangensis]MBO0514677.1 carboxymuconolactone decarboxylase family protein [Streptomyces beijiangensis]